MKEAIELIKERLEKGKSGLTTWAEDEAFKLGIEKAQKIVSEVEAEYGNPKTNADRIRSMSDEELAKFLYKQDFCVDERCPRLWDEINCVECIAEWLKAEVKEET